MHANTLRAGLLMHSCGAAQRRGELAAAGGPACKPSGQCLVSACAGSPSVVPYLHQLWLLFWTCNIVFLESGVANLSNTLKRCRYQARGPA